MAMNDLGGRLDWSQIKSEPVLYDVYYLGPYGTEPKLEDLIMRGFEIVYYRWIPRANSAEYWLRRSIGD